MTCQGSWSTARDAPFRKGGWEAGGGGALLFQEGGSPSPAMRYSYNNVVSAVLLQCDELIGHIAQADSFRVLQLAVPVGRRVNGLERVSVRVFVLADDA